MSKTFKAAIYETHGNPADAAARRAILSAFAATRAMAKGPRQPTGWPDQDDSEKTDANSLSSSGLENLACMSDKV